MEPFQEPQHRLVRRRRTVAGQHGRVEILSDPHPPRIERKLAEIALESGRRMPTLVPLEGHLGDDHIPQGGTGRIAGANTTHRQTRRPQPIHQIRRDRSG
jgi:hypothetical protein